MSYLLKKPSIQKSPWMALWVTSNVAASFLVPVSMHLELTSLWEGFWHGTSAQGFEDGMWASRRALGKHCCQGNTGEHRDRRLKGQAWLDSTFPVLCSWKCRPLLSNFRVKLSPSGHRPGALPWWPGWWPRSSTLGSTWAWLANQIRQQLH